MTEARRGFFPFVTGDQVSLSQGGAIALVARDDLQVSQGGSQVIGAGNRINVTQGGSWLMGAGSTITVDQGGAGIIGARNVRAERSFVGVVFGRRVEVEGSKVLVGSSGSFVAGLVVGAVLGSIARFRRSG